MAKRNNTKIALSILALGGATAAVVFGSWAAWTAQTTNPGNTVTSGELSLSNDRGNNTAIFDTNVSDILPGDTETETVTIGNTGDAALDVTLAVTNAADDISDGTHNVMRYTIQEQGGDCIYPAGPGACPAMSTTATGGAWADVAPVTLTGDGAGGEWDPTETHTYEVTWMFTSNATVDNTKNVAGNEAAFDLEFVGTTD